MKKYRVGLKIVEQVSRVIEADSKTAARRQIRHLFEMGKLNTGQTDCIEFVEEVGNL